MSESEKKHSKIQWFFFVILIPIIFAIILFVIVMSVLGFDMMEKGKQLGASIPYVNQYFIEEEEEEINLEELLEQISNQDRSIEQLQRQIEQKNEEIDKLLSEAQDLGQELDQREEIAVDIQRDLKEIAKTYESMSAKNAANILSELDINEALLHISQVKTDARANILSKMEPEKAAEIMSLLANQ